MLLILDEKTSVAPEVNENFIIATSCSSLELDIMDEKVQVAPEVNENFIIATSCSSLEIDVDTE